MSLTMYGGPAEDQAFACRRAPRLLRVVCSPSGKWDCLDQLADEPRPRESIHVYEQFRYFTGAFICPGGWTEFADYGHVVSARPRSNLDRVLRDTGSWRRFVEAYFGVTLGADGERVADVVQLRAHALEAVDR